MTIEKITEDIRTKCIEANPKIKNRNDEDLGNGIIGTCFSLPTIHLADVLLAIESDVSTGNLADRFKELCCEWNLKETFENQSEPTKRFIHSLLHDHLQVLHKK